MPTYVYECKKCTAITEVEQRITEAALKDCECGGRDTMIRLIQPPAVMFKGSGFYVNDCACASGSNDSAPVSECAASGG